MPKIIFTPNMKAAEKIIREVTKSGDDYMIITKPEKLFPDLDPITEPYVIDVEGGAL